MNNFLDTENEGTEGPESDRRVEDKNLKFLERLIDKAIQRLEDDSFKPRIQDALKAIQLKEKVAKTSEGEKAFWEMIEEVRQEELPKLYHQEPICLETQIQNTILGLKDQVKNGVLALKIITDTFNQGKSEVSQLSYQRIGRLLFTMGFRKAKIHNNSSAIIWDDTLLSRNGPSGIEKDEKPSSPSPPYPPSHAFVLPSPQVRGWNFS